MILPSPSKTLNKEATPCKVTFQNTNNNALKFQTRLTKLDNSLLPLHDKSRNFGSL